MPFNLGRGDTPPHMGIALSRGQELAPPSQDYLPKRELASVCLQDSTSAVFFRLSISPF